MTKKIVFDLDGVIRDLNRYLVEKYNIPYPKEWNWTYKGKDIWWYSEKDKNMLVLNSKTTEYYDVIKKYCDEIWTCQPDRWKDKTKKWVYKYLGSNVKLLFLTTKEKRERLNKEKNTILIEDSPNFENYDRILLIDRLYNKKVKATRIRNPKQLEKILRTERNNDRRK